MWLSVLGSRTTNKTRISWLLLVVVARGGCVMLFVCLLVLVRLSLRLGEIRESRQNSCKVCVWLTVFRHVYDTRLNA